ncbi:MAG TPA: hypothetical protein VFE53_03845 [Mucilaginibacter sp.]|jgi:hypothetical protein|nr:hypothetical protein [Mucilaginibacter sp.]
MTNPIDYIVFEPDQVLTDVHLNETFQYLDQQNRWTRNKLIGIGIVCGFDIVLKPGIIEITQGCGITSQGFLISQCLKDYTRYIPYAAPVWPQINPPFINNGNVPFYQTAWTNKNLFKLITDGDYSGLDSAQQSTAVTISSATNFLLDYVVVLFLEATETSLKNCNMLDCNNGGATMTFTLQPLLVAIADLPGATTNSSNSILINNINFDLLNQVSLKRFNVPYTALNTTNDVLNAFVNLVDDTTLTQLSNAYNTAFNNYGGMVNVSTNPFTNLLSTLQGYRNVVLSQNPVFIQYFYDLVDDLIKAWYEFSVTTSDIMDTCCPDENLFPLHLVLGSASEATTPFAKDSYRNYFMYSGLFSQMGDNGASTVLLFNRMVIMVNQFAIQSQALQLQAALKITPSLYECALLSERAIPYYYNLDVNGAELYKYWSYYKTSHGRAAFNLSYNANLYSVSTTVTQPLLYDIERFNFFRIEGHIGQNYNTVLTNILNQRLNYNLPFDVVAISADQLQSGASLPACNMNDLNTDYQLIISEAACKIHLTFCFVSKLPYVVTQTPSRKRTSAQLFDVTNPAALKFSTFKLSQETIIPSLLHITSAYQKGDFMRKYCTPLPNTIGSAYLSALDTTGVFTNPVKVDQGNPLTIVYYYLFQFIDSVEQLMYVLQTNTLAQLDINAFNTTYQTYIADTLLALSILTELTISTNASATGNSQFVTLAEDTELALIIDELSLLTNICIEERLQVLTTEYATRLTNYQQQLTFLNYYKNHPGLEHKAGVPKGGTFVLVYHSGAADTSITTTNANAAPNNLVRTDMTVNTMVDPTIYREAISPVLANLDDPTLNLIASFINDCNDAPPATKQTLIGILNRIPPKRIIPGYSIADGTVIADFYIPYLCCSDCPPVAYVLPDPVTPPPAKPTITMATTFCDNDTKASPIKVSAPGGTFNTVKGLVGGTKPTFTPATAGAGSYQVIYTDTNGVASDPVTVTVLATAANTFTVKSAVNDVNGVPVITANFVPDTQNNSFQYQWQFGPGFNVTSSTEELPQLTATLDPTGGQTETTASLVVSNGTCSQAAVTKNLIISPNGVFEVAANTGILSGIKNLFNKKG